MLTINISAGSLDELRQEAEKFLKDTEPKIEEQIPFEPVPIVAPVALTEEVTPTASAPVLPPSIPDTPLPISGPIVGPAPLPIDLTTLDKRGLPWDERIHATSKSTSKDGSWRYRRSVEESEVAKVEQELLARIKGQPVEATFAPPVTVAPPPPVIPPSIDAHTVTTFKANLVPTLARLVSEGKLTQNYIDQLRNYFQVDYIWSISDQQCEELFKNFCDAGLLVQVNQ